MKKKSANTKPLFKVNATGAEILAKVNAAQEEFEASRKKGRDVKEEKKNTTIVIHCDKRRKAEIEARAKRIGVTAQDYLLCVEYLATSK